MNTPLDESNLDHIGGDDDARAKQFAAETEVNWKGAGEAVGIQVWRVENKRDENDNPKVGASKLMFKVLTIACAHN